MSYTTTFKFTEINEYSTHKQVNIIIDGGLVAYYYLRKENDNPNWLLYNDDRGQLVNCFDPFEDREYTFEGYKNLSKAIREAFKFLTVYRQGNLDWDADKYYDIYNDEDWDV